MGMGYDRQRTVGQPPTARNQDEPGNGSSAIEESVADAGGTIRAPTLAGQIHRSRTHSVLKQSGADEFSDRSHITGCAVEAEACPDRIHHHDVGRG